MTTTHTYKPWTGVDFSTVRFEATQKNGKWRTEIPKPTLRFITPAMRTNWPKLGKDADIGTHYGPPPEERHKAKFQVDLTDLAIFDGSNTHEFKAFEEKLQQADDALLDFMHTRQGVLLQRTGLSKENLAMLQNRSVKPKLTRRATRRTAPSCCGPTSCSTTAPARWPRRRCPSATAMGR